MPHLPVLTGESTGDTYQLGPPVGSGGQGVVHAVVGKPELLAKIYRHPLCRNDIDRLHTLVPAGTPELFSVAAWPVECLKNAAGAIVGFAMPRITDAQAIHELYSPRGRISHFPSADFRFLVHAAANVARLFAKIHRAGFIIGDVNHGNILVRDDATTAAIDCDSFQVGDGARFRCQVGVELFTPPELARFDLAAVRRTENHDAFGLAVLIFHLLFMGRHPFAGRFLDPGEMPIETAIIESRFAYSTDTARTRMAPPPFTPPLLVCGASPAGMFEQAFHPAARQGGRPSPADWICALDSLLSSLAVCRSVAWHQYEPNLAECPWCTIERASGARLFGGVVRPAPSLVADLQTLWARYLAIRDPRPPRPAPREEDWSPPPAKAPARYPVVLRRIGRAAGLVQLGLAVICLPVSPAAALAAFCAGALSLRLARRPRISPEARSAALDAFLQADHAWQALLQEWQAQSASVDFSAQRRAIEALKTELDAIASERETRIRALLRPVAEEQQRASYLAQFRIDKAELFNMGPARCAVLRSWGIETAAEVDESRIATIPGFGRNLTERLVNWREGLERAFRFEPAACADPVEVQRIDREMAARRIPRMNDLRTRIAVLENQVRRVRDERAALRRRLEAAFDARMRADRAYKQAQRD